jgi:hypothetical protein
MKDIYFPLVYASKEETLEMDREDLASASDLGELRALNFSV